MESLPNEVLLNIVSFLKGEDLLPCRLMSKQWNSLASEVLKKKCPLITISTKMEALYFLHLSKSATTDAIFTRIRIAVNKIPIEVLSKLAHEFSQHKTQLTLFRQFEKEKTEVLQKGQILLRQLQGITYLKIECGTKLLGDNDLPVLASIFAISTLTHLTKIVWNEADKTLLLAILQRAPALRTLEVQHWHDIGSRATLRYASLVMEYLPVNALLTTAIPIDCTQGRPEFENMLKMCQFQNKIANLTFQSVLYKGTVDWKKAITRLLASQSMSLTKLDLKCKQIFAVPKLEKLEILKLREVAEVGLNPSNFHSFKEFAVRADVSKHEVVGNKVWPTVSTLELVWSWKAVPLMSYFLCQVGLNFPNLKLLKIHLRQLPELIRFCSRNTVPAEELCVYVTNNECSRSMWEEVCESIRKLLSEDFPSSYNQVAGSTLGFLRLAKMRVVDVDEGILKFVELASRRGIIKLNFLELNLIGSPGFEAYKSILSKYHDIVVIKSSNDRKDEENSGDESQHYVPPVRQHYY